VINLMSALRGGKSAHTKQIVHKASGEGTLALSIVSGRENANDPRRRSKKKKRRDCLARKLGGLYSPRDGPENRDVGTMEGEGGEEEGRGKGEREGGEERSWGGGRKIKTG